VAGGNLHYPLTVDPCDSRIENHLPLLANLCPGLSEYRLSELRIMLKKKSILYVWGEPLTHAVLHPFAVESAGALSMPLVVDVLERLVQSISISPPPRILRYITNAPTFTVCNIHTQKSWH
jgi:hypothetical protein